MIILHEHYKKEMKTLQKQLQCKSIMQVPRFEKIVINTCISEAIRNPKLLERAAEELTQIAGQKAVITKAQKAVANFKLREGMPLGVKVTLREERMWCFLERLIHVTLPRVRDFRGLSPKGFDGRGNYNMGLKEHIVFPEINYDKVDRIWGMNITICTNSKDDAGAEALLKALGFPFKKK